MVVVHGVAKTAYFGVAGDAIHENDSSTPLGRAGAGSGLLDEDVVTMAPDTEFSVDSFQDQRAEGKKTSVFSMAKGKAMFYAMRLFRYRDTRFTLNTPTVTVGVRGTKFGVDVVFTGEEKRAEQRAVQVADLGNEIAPYLAQAGGPPEFHQCLFRGRGPERGGPGCGTGQMFNGQSNQVIPTPPEVIRNFQQATGMGASGAKGALRAGTCRWRDATSAGDGNPGSGTAGGSAGRLTNQTSVQTGAQTERVLKTEEKVVPYTGILYGYFAGCSAGMPALSRPLPRKASGRVSQLQRLPGNAPPFTNVPPGITGVNNNEDPLTKLRMQGVLNPSDFIEFSGSNSLPDLACIGGSCANWMPDTPESSGIITYLGQNAYAQWGYWTSTIDTSFTITSGSYPGTYSAANDTVWFTEARHIATMAEIASVAAGDYTYSGVAHGTYYNGPANAAMSGNFTSLVNLGGSPSVRNFDLNVSGGGHSASLVWSGTQPINTSSSGNFFAITGDTTARIDGVAVGHGVVSGSLVGHAAEGMIGAWGVGTSGGPGAAGIYSGTR